MSCFVAGMHQHKKGGGPVEQLRREYCKLARKFTLAPFASPSVRQIAVVVVDLLVVMVTLPYVQRKLNESYDVHAASIRAFCSATK